MNKFMFAASAAVFFVTSFHHDICALSQNPSTTNPSSVSPSSYPVNHEVPTTGGTPAHYNTYQKNHNIDINATQQAKPASADATVVKVAADDATISTFASALQSVDLNEILDRPGPYTILAPSNDAFRKLSPETLANLLKPENKEKLKAILKNHIIPGKLTSADIKETTLYSLDGKPVAFKVVGKEVTANGAKIIKTDIVGSNGVIHIIDTVLVPKN